MGKKELLCYGNANNAIQFSSIASFDDYLQILHGFALMSNAECRNSSHPLFLFRGQKAGSELKSSIEYIRKSNDSIHLGRRMFLEFKERCGFSATYNDWDILSFARHFGLPSRYLDWSSNPLVALWFACHSIHEPINEDGVVWVLRTELSDFADIDLNDDPFPVAHGKTCIFKPTEMECRIKNQNSFMMRQVYEYKNPEGRRTRKPKDMEIRSVDVNPIYKGRLWCMSISNSLFEAMCERLTCYRITQDFLFPETHVINVKEIREVINEIKAKYGQSM